MAASLGSSSDWPGGRSSGGSKSCSSFSTDGRAAQQAKPESRSAIVAAITDANAALPD
eukprot:CAMPEP_0198598342 /NCGR_PEP_ID=MMETSP1462-20131121/145514_1 /TAXON_ID=1333877 /ORGANISM="Brandtodinium nutriculum, Strain RCC3387" /LENGTH=57 /DNA_ID=CAMNT_0044330003 /DNA_START=17 /DNA_END=190 /DNA_ORIENTATION=+